jgi:hypothetical protein
LPGAFFIYDDELIPAAANHPEEPFIVCTSPFLLRLHPFLVCGHSEMSHRHA